MECILSTDVVNTRPQIIFSFDVIRAIENTYGQTLWNGKTELVDKIEIAKSIVTDFTAIISGYASNEKAKYTYTRQRYLSGLTTNNTWDSPVISHAESYGMPDTDLVKTIPIDGYIDAEGYLHFTNYGDLLTFDGGDSYLLADYAKLDITLDDTLAPDAPTDLQAVSEVGAITLKWTGDANAISYNVYKSTMPGTGYELITNTGELAYVDHTSNTDSNVYYYVVNSVNQAGASDYSNEVMSQAIPEPQPEPEPQQEYTERNIFVPDQYWTGDGINQEAREIIVKKYNAGARQTIRSQYPFICIRTYQ